MIKLINKKNGYIRKMHDVWCVFDGYDKVTLSFPNASSLSYVCTCSDAKCTSLDLIEDFDKVKESNWYLIDSNNKIFNINNRNIITDEEMEKWKIKNYEEIKESTYFATRQNNFNGRIFYNFTISALVGISLDEILSNTRDIIIDKILK